MLYSIEEKFKRVSPFLTDESRDILNDMAFRLDHSNTLQASVQEALRRDFEALVNASFSIMSLRSLAPTQIKHNIQLAMDAVTDKISDVIIDQSIGDELYDEEAIAQYKADEDRIFNARTSWIKEKSIEISHPAGDYFSYMDLDQNKDRSRDLFNITCTTPYGSEVFATSIQITHEKMPLIDGQHQWVSSIEQFGDASDLFSIQRACELVKLAKHSNQDVANKLNLYNKAVSLLKSDRFPEVLRKEVMNFCIPRIERAEEYLNNPPENEEVTAIRAQMNELREANQNLEDRTIALVKLAKAKTITFSEFKDMGNDIKSSWGAYKEKFDNALSRLKEHGEKTNNALRNFAEDSEKKYNAFKDSEAAKTPDGQKIGKNAANNIETLKDNIKSLNDALGTDQIDLIGLAINGAKEAGKTLAFTMTTLIQHSINIAKQVHESNKSINTMLNVSERSDIKKSEKEVSKEINAILNESKESEKQLQLAMFNIGSLDMQIERQLEQLRAERNKHQRTKVKELKEDIKDIKSDIQKIDAKIEKLEEKTIGKYLRLGNTKQLDPKLYEKMKSDLLANMPDKDNEQRQKLLDEKADLQQELQEARAELRDYKDGTQRVPLTRKETRLQESIEKLMDKKEIQIKNIEKEIVNIDPQALGEKYVDLKGLTSDLQEKIEKCSKYAARSVEYLKTSDRLGDMAERAAHGIDLYKKMAASAKGLLDNNTEKLTDQKDDLNSLVDKGTPSHDDGPEL